MKLALAILCITATAHADPAKDVAGVLDNVLWTAGPSTTSRFAFTTYGVNELGSDGASLAVNDVSAKQVIVGVSGTDAFVAADVVEGGDCGGDGPNCGAQIGLMHGTFMFEKADGNWTPVVWHMAEVVGPRDEGSAVAPAVIPRKVTGAEDVAKLFESTVGDPKALAKTVSDRKEVVMYGSAGPERFVGGAKVRAKLLAWNLSLTVRDGVQAGLSHGKTLAWVAANVDARSAKDPKAKPTPYRLLVIYEKSAGAWKVVSASFSLYTGRS